MNSIDTPLYHAQVSLTEALVAALQSEDAETAFVEETRQFVDLLGDTLTLPFSAILNFDHMGQQTRRELLEITLAKLGLKQDALNWQECPALAIQFQNRIWKHIYQRFLNTHQVLSSHVELFPAPEPDYPRPLFTPNGSWLLLYVESGACHLAGDIDTRVDSPAVLILPPQSSVELSRARDGIGCSLFTSAFFPREHWQALLPSAADWPGPEPIEVSDPRVASYLTESMGRIIDITHSRARHAQALHFNLLEHTLLFCDELRPDREETHLDRRVIAARDYLLAHYREKTTVEQVAAAANAAPSTLNALFKSQIGENLMRWRDQLRMQRARELLQNSDMPVKVIATEVGYDDPMFFSRRFKQLTGWSPSQVRNGTTI